MVRDSKERRSAKLGHGNGLGLELDATQLSDLAAQHGDEDVFSERGSSLCCQAKFSSRDFELGAKYLVAGYLSP